MDPTPEGERAEEILVKGTPIELTELDALEILDSRGFPTVKVFATDVQGRVVAAAVPSGASTGGREAHERRDGDPERFGGKGVLNAVEAVRGPIREAVCGRQWASLSELDSAMRALDGSPDLSHLGANAILGVSVAAGRAFCEALSLELYDWLSGQCPPGRPQRMPVPHFNVVNGGAHAGNDLAFQEFMVAPVGAGDVASAIRAGAEIYQALRRRLARSGQSTALGDEGGFAPDVSRPDEVLDLLVSAIDDAGYSAGRNGVMLALDPAANGFFQAGRYQVGEESLSSDELVELYADLVDRFPIWSIEDGCSEDDRDGWKLLTGRLGDTVQLVADDIACTRADMVTLLANSGIANAVLVKPNQVGTVSDTLETVRTAIGSGYSLMVSHRSGDTVDDLVADLAVGIGCGQLKSGAPARGERVAKYNRLLEIAHRNPPMPFGLPPRAARAGWR